LKDYVARNAERLEKAGASAEESTPLLAARLLEAANRLAEMAPILDAPGRLDLEDFERRLTVVEERLTAALSADADEETMVAVRREMDRSLAPYRRKMSAEQLAQLERQYLQKRLFDQFGVPRLSLFYLT
jgi:hypothetical protein